MATNDLAMTPLGVYLDDFMQGIENEVAQDTVLMLMALSKFMQGALYPTTQPLISPCSTTYCQLCLKSRSILIYGGIISDHRTIAMRQRK